MKLARSGLSPARTFIMLLQPPTNLGIAGAQPHHRLHQPQSASLTPTTTYKIPQRGEEKRRGVKARNQFADDYDGWRGRLATAAK